MEITGYKIREALRRHILRRETAQSQFKPSMFAFPGEEKPTPDEITQRVDRAEKAIANLQVLQTRYNLAVQVDVPGDGRRTLLDCIKRIGGLARIEKSWRTLATEKEDRFDTFGLERSREKDREVAVRRVSPDEASARTERYDQQLATLREAIAIGNAQKVSFEDLDTSLFE